MDTISHDLKVPALAQLRCLEQLTNGYYGELDISQKSVVKELEQSCKSVINIIEMLTCSYNLDAKIIKLCYEKCNFKLIADYDGKDTLGNPEIISVLLNTKKH